MVAKSSELLRGEKVWYRPCFCPSSDMGERLIGDPSKSEDKARALAGKLAHRLLACGFTNAWRIGIARSFNRASVPTDITWAEPHGTKVPALGPPPGI